jgi:oligoendopeptidase F
MTAAPPPGITAPGTTKAGGIDPHDWRTIAPHYTALLEHDLQPAGVPAWLARWSDLQTIVWEARAGPKRERSRDLTDETNQRAFQRFAERVMAPFAVANEALTAKLLGVSGWEPALEQVQMLRQLRAAAGLTSAENAAREAEIGARVGEYSQLQASMTATIDGRDVPVSELARRLQEADRDGRETAWRAAFQPWRRAREHLDALSLALLARRRRLAANAGLPDYRAYRWRELGRLDYTPADCLRFHDAVAAEFVPLAARLAEARRAALGVATLRPWDTAVDPASRPPLEPFTDLETFEEAMAGVFARLDPEVGALFARLRRGFLDLGRRRGKQGGGEEWNFPLTGLPYVLVGDDGTDAGVDLLLHEMGHAYHDSLVMGTHDLIFNWQYPDEFAEFAAIAMTHFARPELARDRGGFYSPEEAARARDWYLEELVVNGLVEFSLLDTFQHWVYAEAPADLRPADLGAKWIELSARFKPWLDWTGLAAERAAGWLRRGLTIEKPFYFVTYELVHLGALQLAQVARADPATAWRDYRAALALGSTRSLPALYAAAGARLPFDSDVVREAARFVAAQLGV